MSKAQEDAMFSRRDAIEREDGYQDPEFPEIENLPTEDCCLTYLGNGNIEATFVSRFVNKGVPVHLDDVVFMSVAMVAMQLRGHWQDKRTNEWLPYWRVSTEEEVALYEKRKDTSDLTRAGRKELSRKAREDAINDGQASFETEKEHAEDDAIRSTRRPRRKRNK